MSFTTYIPTFYHTSTKLLPHFYYHFHQAFTTMRASRCRHAVDMTALGLNVVDVAVLEDVVALSPCGKTAFTAAGLEGGRLRVTAALRASASTLGRGPGPGFRGAINGIVNLRGRVRFFYLVSHSHALLARCSRSPLRANALICM